MVEETVLAVMVAVPKAVGCTAVAKELVGSGAVAKVAARAVVKEEVAMVMRVGVETVVEEEVVGSVTEVSKAEGGEAGMVLADVVWVEVMAQVVWQVETRLEVAQKEEAMA